MDELILVFITLVITVSVGFPAITRLYLLFFGEKAEPESATMRSYVRRRSSGRSRYYEVVYTWTDTQGREHTAVEVGLSESGAKRMADGNAEIWPVIHYSKCNPDWSYVSSNHISLIVAWLMFPFLAGLCVLFCLAFFG